MTEHTEDDTDTDNEAADQTDAGAVTLACVAIISGETELIIRSSSFVNVDFISVLVTWSTAFVHFCKELHHQDEDYLVSYFKEYPSLTRKYLDKLTSRTFLDRFITRFDRWLVLILRTLDVCPLVLGSGALQQVVGVGNAGEAVDTQTASH